jgi:RNA polymerase sigma-70 factor, ECF subfamily
LANLTVVEPVDLATAFFSGHAAAQPGATNVSPRVRAAYEEGAARWPGVEVAPERFARHLGAREDPEDPLGSLDRLEICDLYLVCAVLDGNARAQRLFDEELGQRIGPALHGLGIGEDLVDEARQRLRHLLLVPRDDAPRRLETYVGRGSVWGWARVIAVREALALARRRGRDASRSDAPLVDDLEEDPELDFLKATYRSSFRDAFATAIESLESRERLALRLHHVEGLTLERTAELLGVHRATAARWLAGARERILARTRDEMRRLLRIEDGGLDSIMELIASRFEVSLSRILATPGEERA